MVKRCRKCLNKNRICSKQRLQPLPSLGRAATGTITFPRRCGGCATASPGCDLPRLGSSPFFLRRRKPLRFRKPVVSICWMDCNILRQKTSVSIVSAFQLTRFQQTLVTAQHPVFILFHPRKMWMQVVFSSSVSARPISQVGFNAQVLLMPSPPALARGNWRPPRPQRPRPLAIQEIASFGKSTVWT